MQFECINCRYVACPTMSLQCLAVCGVVRYNGLSPFHGAYKLKDCLILQSVCHLIDLALCALSFV